MKLTNTTDGLGVQAVTQSVFSVANVTGHPIAIAKIRIAAAHPTPALFFWQEKGAPEGTWVQLPFDMKGTGKVEEITLNLERYHQWDPLTQRFGFAVPENSTVMISSVEVFGITMFERIWEMLKSFWTFDTYHSYSINFLWGPILATNPIWRAMMFEDQPPQAHSGVWVFYALVLIGGIVSIVWPHTARGRTSKIGTRALMALTIAVVWIFFDARMGLETLSYHWTDATTFVFAEEGSRDFRDWNAFPDLMDYVNANIAETESFAIVTDYATPFTIGARYLAYPRVALDLRAAGSGVTTWAIHEKNQARVLEDGRLSIDGTVVSAPGQIVKQFSPRSFLFQTTP